MTDTERYTFVTNGYLTIQNALSAEEVAVLNDALDRDFTQRRETYYNRGDGTHQSVRVMEVETAFDALITHPSTFEMLQDLMGKNIAFSELSVIIKEPQTDSHAGWHKDAGYSGVDLTRALLMISSIFYLTDVPPGGACFTVVPGSHRFDWPMPKVDHLDEMPGQVELTGNAGMVILFNANLWHCAKPNRADLWRKTVHLYYCHSWMKPSGHTKFPLRLLEGADTPFLKQLFHANWGAVQ